ncbi:glycosyltransferase family 2 protein [Aeromonas veronii]|uniref:glycosyltransferase family 2 protein n=1 Tax=Aeromonas veronii TaxID=654 RepID=UPI003B9E934E
MNAKPVVSVVIPVFNREKYISDCIDSVIAQDYENVEIIVIDNCSTDSTREICLDYKSSGKIKFIENSYNVGPVKNWLKGIEDSSGEYCWLLFSDDMIYSPNVISTLVDNVIKNDCNMAFGIVNIGADISSSVPFYSVQDTCEVFSYHDYIKRHVINFGQVPVSPAAYIVKTEYYKKVLPQLVNEFSGDESMLNTGAGIDLLLLTRSVRMAGRVLFVNRVVSFFRSHAGSFSSSHSDAVFKKYNDIRMLLTKEFSFLLRQYSYFYVLVSKLKLRCKSKYR